MRPLLGITLLLSITASVTSFAESVSVRVLLSAKQETILASPIAAKVKVLNASIGSSFKKGDVLIGFNCDEQRAQLSMAEAEYKGANAELNAKQKMYDLGQASDVEVAMAISKNGQSKAQIDLNKARYNRCTVRAPFTGRVAKLHVKNHMTVAAGEPLLELVGNGPLMIRLNVPSSALGLLQQSHPMSVVIDETGVQYDAFISARSARVDAVSQTIEMRGEMETEYPELLAGMSGTATIELDHAEAE
jgi:membrane fusion protein (multidrug efflux system)